MSHEFDDDEQVIAEAIRDARHIQEFIWGDESASQRHFDPETWRVIFQKRVDKIAEIDVSKPGAMVELRKRLIQQAALSIKAMNVLRKFHQ